MVSEAPPGQLIHDEGNSAMNLAPQDLVGGNESVADDAGKVWFGLILGKEGEVREVLMGVDVGVWSVIDIPNGQYQGGRVSDATAVS